MITVCDSICSLSLFIGFFLLDNEGERDLSRYNIHAICGVLKLWLRELPESLMTFDLYDTIVRLESVYISKKEEN